MARRFLATLAVLLAASSCGTEGTNEPVALAFADANEAAQNLSLADAPVVETNLMRLSIGGERFELQAGICNTYGDGTFQFALAEGELADGGTVTATIERFDSGSSFDVALALEGLRADASSVTWYAKDQSTVHQINETIVGPEIRGTALFTPIEDDSTAAAATPGEFSLRCAP